MEQISAEDESTKISKKFLLKILCNVKSVLTATKGVNNDKMQQ